MQPSPTIADDMPGTEDEEIVARLRAFASGTEPTESASAEAILELLQRTRSRRVRNAAALALADRRVRAAEASLTALLERADLADSAGTLVYALDEVGGTLSADALVNLVRHGSYEARSEALNLAAEGRITASPQKLRAAKRALAAMRRNADADAAQAATQALEELEALTASP